MTTSVNWPRAWRRAQEGWPRRFPIVQFPNLPLLAALIARAVEALTVGGAARVAHGVFAVTLGVWAWQELFNGANWFRRLLGAAGIALAVWSAIGSL